MNRNEVSKMDEKNPELEAERLLRSAMGRSIRSALASTAARLQRAADGIRALEEDVDRIGLPPKSKGQRPLTAEALLAEALLVLHGNAPDLGNLARTVEEYNRHVVPEVPVNQGECQVIYANRPCGTEALPGAVLCFKHLWQTARGRGVGNVFPLGSPEPSEARVPRGVALVGENGVHWIRNGDRWLAGGPAGDGGLYPWSAVNGTGNETGRELARLFPEYAR